MNDQALQVPAQDVLQTLFEVTDKVLGVTLTEESCAPGYAYFCMLPLRRIHGLQADVLPVDRQVFARHCTLGSCSGRSLSCAGERC